MARAAKKANQTEKYRNPPDFMSPTHLRTSNKGMWTVPSAEKLVEYLRKEYGDVKALLFKASKSENEHDRVLWTINERLTSKGNETWLAEWERLKGLYEITQTERLKQKVLADILKMNQSERKTKLSDLRMFFSRDKGAETGLVGRPKKKTQKDQATEDANKKLMDQLSLITDRMSAPASTETEEDDDCLEADDND